MTVAAIQGEGHAQRLAVITAEFEAIGAPALVTPGHRDLAVMPTLRARRHGPAPQQQAMDAHDAIDVGLVEEIQRTETVQFLLEHAHLNHVSPYLEVSAKDCRQAIAGFDALYD